MAAVTEEKIPSDVESSSIIEKLNDSLTGSDDVKSDAVLDEIAAKVDALDFNKTEDEENSEDEIITSKRQGDIIKKQAETINTLIQQLRVIFDEFNVASQEKEYYEDLSEALLRYIEICEGKLELERDEEEEKEKQESEKDENIVNILSKESEQPIVNQDNTVTTTTSDDASAVTIPKTTTSQDADVAQTETAAQGEGEVSSNEQVKVTISNNELVRLNHILLKEIIELRNERDVLRSNIQEYLLSEEDTVTEYDTATDDEYHGCDHCTNLKEKKESPESPDEEEQQEEEDEYEEIKDEDMEKIKNESDTE